MTRAAVSTEQSNAPTPLWAVLGVTFLASIGTGVVWNGVPFIAKHNYQFSEYQTLALYVMMGATYVVGAMCTGRVLRAVESVLSPRTVLGIILMMESITCVSLVLVRAGWMLWVVSGMMSVLSSWVWPIVESYLTAGRHGRDMRRAIGWFNLAWTGAVALALVMMLPVMKVDPSSVDVMGVSVAMEPRMAIVLLGMLHMVALIPLVRWGRWPGAHDEGQSLAAVHAEYPMLLKAARMLLPLSYVLNSAMSPLLPYIFTRIAVEQEWQTTVASTWMWVRILAMTVMWNLGFWHGKWGTLLLGGVAMSLGFGIAVLAYSIPMLVFGLAIFGVGMGVIYYAALYYAMAVGRAEVDAGGTHEALIGAGYTVGPLAGLVGVSTTQAAHSAGWDVWDGSILVGIVWMLIGVGAIAVTQPYRKARQARRSGALK